VRNQPERNSIYCMGGHSASIKSGSWEHANGELLHLAQYSFTAHVQKYLPVVKFKTNVLLLIKH